jgi:predicted outer membrane protein
MRRRLTVLGSLVLGILSLPAAGQPLTPPTPVVPPPFSVPGVASADEQFLRDAVQEELGLLALSELTASRSGSARVRAYGLEVTDRAIHAIGRLGELAGPGRSLPNRLSRAQEAEYLRLSALRGPAFDDAYLSAMLAHHERSIQRLVAESEGARNPGLRAYATDLLVITRRQADAALHGGGR